jgi:glycolate oxidase
MTGLGPVDPVLRQVKVEPGVLNDAVTRHASRWGLHFAPDPSSQAASSIGGNIAENAGGPHCLTQGVTLQHLLQLEWTDTAGRVLHTGRGLPAERGLDLMSLLCGSEGTLGLVTAADLKLMANSAAVTTLLAFFPDLEDGARAVVGMLAAGLAPAAVEMVDQPILTAVEAAFGFGFPTDVAAAMITEFMGSSEAVAEDGERAAVLLGQSGAREVRRAADEVERAELWKCRKKAFGAVGRLAPNYVSMDVVVPLGELPGLVRDIQVIKAQWGVEIATSFHAGDGNLHPGVHYDERDAEKTRKAHAAADAIIRTALDRGGSVTGEHGVGIEKLHVLPWQLDGETARLQRGIKEIFDPGAVLNPGKLLTPANAEYAPLKPAPARTDFQWNNLTVSAPASASLADIQQAALARGFWIPVGVVDTTAGTGLGRGTTCGDLVTDLWSGPALCSAGTVRDFLLELWAETGEGKRFHAGAPVFKNVAGYDLAHMLCGSGNIWVRPEAMTFQLRPIPESLGYWRFQQSAPEPGGLGGLEALIKYLSGRLPNLGGPVLVVELKEHPFTVSVVVLVPGRNRPWDLGRVGADLKELLGGHVPAQAHVRPFAQAGELLTNALIPAWALDSPDWTVLGRIPGAVGLAEACPPDTRRFIWQSSPRVVWSADRVSSGSGWHADPFLRDGHRQPAPPPGEKVPVDLLRRLKVLFDPERRLEMPAWLEDEDV